MALPWLSVLFTMVFGQNIWPQSISITYYEDAAMPMLVIILGAASILLFTYEGYEKIDNIVNTLAAVFGLMIILFPCKYDLEHCGAFQINYNVSHAIHMIAAVVFFALLSFNSLFLFTKNAGEMTNKKKIRNIIYRVCGIGMIASFALLIPFELCHVRVGIWIVEAIALMFFGISWLTKSQYYNWLFKD